MSRPRDPARSVGTRACGTPGRALVLLVVLSALAGLIGSGSLAEAAANAGPAGPISGLAGPARPGVSGAFDREVRQIYLAPEEAFLSDSAGFDSARVEILLDDNQTTEAGIRGFHLQITYPADLVEVTAVLPGSLLAVQEHYLNHLLGPTGVLQIDGAVLGATGGITGQGALVLIGLTAATPEPSDDCAPIDFLAEGCILRDPENLPLTSEYAGGLVSYDITPPETPVTSSPTHPTGVPVSADDLEVTWSAVLDAGTCPSGVSGYYLLLDASPTSNPGPAGPYDHFVPFAADSSEHARWYPNLPDGTYYAHVAAYDSVGNAGATAHLGPLEIDTTAPENITGLLAAPTANSDLSVDLAWTNPASDFAGLKLFRHGFGNYPEYDDPPDPGGEPPWPASPAEALAEGWDLIYDGNASNYTDAPDVRDYYYYTAFAYDAAFNSAAPTSEARDSSLAYWLGDFATGGTHVVDIYDVLVLSLAYNTAEGDTAYDPICDIGPTDTYGRFGRPLTDNQVEFDDLILLANNYENTVPPVLDGPGSWAAEAGMGTSTVAAAGVVPPAIPAGGNDAQMTARLELRPRADDRIEVRVHLAGNPGRLKGASLKLDCDPDWVLTGAVAGDLWQESGSHFFFAGPGADGLLWLDAALWSGVVEQDGCHAILLFETPHAAPHAELANATGTGLAPGGVDDLLEAVRIASFRARDDHNRELTSKHIPTMEVALPDAEIAIPAGDALRLPAVFTSEATIHFRLTQAQEIQLSVHDLNGRALALLGEGERTAGAHQITWNGRDRAGHAVPPGVYFVRLQAAADAWVQKTIRLR